MEHFLRFGSFQEQEIFRRVQGLEFDGIGFNANIVAHAGSGITAFLCTHRKDKRFFIDPQTHAFQHDPELTMVERQHGDQKIKAVKSSIRKLADRYGEPVSSRVGEEALLPDDFTDPTLEPFVLAVIDFQRSSLQQYATDGDYMKYLQAVGTTNLTPLFLTPPYFSMTAKTIDEWLPVNLRSVKIGNDAKALDDPPLAAELVIDREVLNAAPLVDRLCSEYGDLPASTILLWVDAFDEAAAGEPLLRSFMQLVEGLSARGKRVINLYGGYFSMLLAKNFRNARLSGVCHSAGYGEDRQIMPVGGGLPTAKFYLRQTHQRLRFNDALRYLRRKGWLATWELYRENVCPCPICEEVLSAGPEAAFIRFGETSVTTFTRRGNVVRLEIPTPEARVLTAIHYLYNKTYELTDVASSQPQDLVAALRAVDPELKRILGLEGVQHMMVWADALSSP